MVFFSYLQLVLSYPLINKISESEEGCPHQFLLCIIPLKLHPLLCLLLYPYSCPRCLPLNLPLLHYLHHPPHCVPLILPILYLHVFPHIRPLKIHPSLCLILSPSLCSHCLPLLIPFFTTSSRTRPMRLFPFHHLNTKNIKYEVIFFRWFAKNCRL